MREKFKHSRSISCSLYVYPVQQQLKKKSKTDICFLIFYFNNSHIVYYWSLDNLSNFGSSKINNIREDPNLLHKCQIFSKFFRFSIPRNKFISFFRTKFLIRTFEKDMYVYVFFAHRNESGTFLQAKS
jgi:hypothetical protein